MDEDATDDVLPAMVSSYEPSSEAAVADSLLQRLEQLLRVLCRDATSLLAAVAIKARDLTVPFADAIDWTETWVILLCIFYAILALTSIFTRNNNIIQMTLFIFAVFGVYFTDRINLLLAHHWESFARRPYFDHRGILLSALWTGPLLSICCIILMNSLLTLLILTIKWKRAEWKYHTTLAEQKKD